MKTFLHLLKYNIIFNKTRLGFLSVMVVFMVFLVNYFMETQKDFGEGLMQYSSYILFVLFTGKMNARNSQMFDIKHLLAMPMTKKEIIITKSLADLVLFLPVAITFLWGFSIRFPEYHIALTSIILVCLLTIGNIVAFSKRIDFFRMQHSKSHLRNFFLYIHKYLELMIVIVLVAISVSLIFGVFQKNTLMLEYSFIVILVSAAFISSMNALKMLKDETLSYFILKRDVFRVGWKLLLFIVPAVGFHYAYKGDIKDFHKKYGHISPRVLEATEMIGNIESKRFVMAILSKDKEYFKDYIAKKKPIPWEEKVKGMYLIHMATLSGEPEILQTLIDLNKETVNQPGYINHSTPLFVAMRECRLDMAEILLENGARVDHVNKVGDTPAIYAAHSGCSGGLLQLAERGADFEHKNKKNKTAFDYLKKQRNGLFFYFKTKNSREIASEKPSPALPKELPE